MIDFTPDAKRKFDEYLQRMRVSLRGTRSVEPDEVEQNVVEHVELALAGAPVPVGAERLSAVLEQLGPPERWLPEEERPWWRRVMDRVKTGPDDWRLAYASFALTMLTVLLLPVGVGFLLLVPAFLLSRAYVELMSERGETLGARRWLVLPPIAMVMVLVCALALLGPVGMMGAVIEELDLSELGFQFSTRAEHHWVFLGCLTVAAGAWWIVLAGIWALLMRPFRAAFAPLTSRLRRAHVFVLAVAGLVLEAIGSALLWAL